MPFPRESHTSTELERDALIEKCDQRTVPNTCLYIPEDTDVLELERAEIPRQNTFELEKLESGVQWCRGWPKLSYTDQSNECLSCELLG